MKYRPILMSAPMVRACLDGSKTQTRRALRVQPGPSCEIEEGFEGESPFVYSALHGNGPGHDVHESRTPCKCPYGQPGDHLWVRESFWAYGKWVKNGHTKKGKQRWAFRFHRDQIVSFDANPDGARIKRGEAGYGWVRRPGIHMPRWACRIELELTGVRVERLQSITEDDAMAEGIKDLSLMVVEYGLRGDEYDALRAATAKLAYANLWNSINGPDSWDANPFVWVIEFKRVKPQAGRHE